MSHPLSSAPGLPLIRPDLGMRASGGSPISAVSGTPALLDRIRWIVLHHYPLPQAGSTSLSYRRRLLCATLALYWALRLAKPPEVCNRHYRFYQLRRADATAYALEPPGLYAPYPTLRLWIVVSSGATTLKGG